MVTTGRLHGGLFLNLGSIEHVIPRICIHLFVIFLAGGEEGGAGRGHYPVPGFSFSLKLPFQSRFISFSKC